MRGFIKMNKAPLDWDDQKSELNYIKLMNEIETIKAMVIATRSDIIQLMAQLDQR